MGVVLVPVSELGPFGSELAEHVTWIVHASVPGLEFVYGVGHSGGETVPGR